MFRSDSETSLSSVVHHLRAHRGRSGQLTGSGTPFQIDLDTIDLSNLNRQFLFQKQHVKRPKALVAKETASKFNPSVKIDAIHGNVKEPQYDVEWFKSFDLVMNALDNLGELLQHS